MTHPVGPSDRCRPANGCKPELVGEVMKEDRPESHLALSHNNNVYGPGVLSDRNRVAPLINESHPCPPSQQRTAVGIFLLLSSATGCAPYLN